MRYIKKRALSFKYAFKGLFLLICNEPNAKVHICCASLAILMGIYFKINTTEWCIISIAIGMVIATEALNTALEKLADIISPDIDPKIGEVKDMAAAGVLVVAIAALVIGLMIFIPKMAALIKV